MNTCEIIAEIGSTHDGSLGNACRMIESAAGCGVDVVKFQTHIPEAETLPDAPMPPFFKGEPRFEYFKRTGFDPDQWRLLKRTCEKNGMEFMSSVFSIEAVDLLEEIGVERYKIPSGEVTNLPMLEYVAKTGKSIILSSGMSNWKELDEAVEVITNHNRELTVLQCTSAYPAKYEEIGLNIMLEMKERYGLPVGLSDHSLRNYPSFTAAALGASVIEKHFTLSKEMYGSDARHSLEPHEFSDLVDGIRAIGLMLSSRIDKDDTGAFGDMKAIFEKSIVTVKDIREGQSITRDMLAVKKPGTGIPPKFLEDAIGSRAARDIDRDHVLVEEDLDVPQGRFG